MRRNKYEVKLIVETDAEGLISVNVVGYKEITETPEDNEEHEQ